MGAPAVNEDWIRCLLSSLLLVCCWQSQLSMATDNAAGLRQQYQRLAPQLEQNQFQRPLHLDSIETASTLKGDIYAVVDHPFASVKRALNDPRRSARNWCDVLILHLNTKYCRPSTTSQGTVLDVYIGKKEEQALADAFRVRFNYRSTASAGDYFEVQLDSAQGPLGTRDYHIALEAVAIDDQRSFLHLTYSYSYGMAGRLAMKSYLATIGSGKVGFTRIGNRSAKLPQYIGGVRGVVERNTMRYYLAIDAYLGALGTRPEKRLQQRLKHWFDATEQYALQLHEVEREAYMQMKLREYQRQQTTP